MRASLGGPFLTNWPYDLVCFAFQRSHGGLPHARENATTRQWNAACVDRHLGSISYRLGFSKAELTPRQRLPLDANTYVASSLAGFQLRTRLPVAELSARALRPHRHTEQRSLDLALLIKDTSLAGRSRHSQSIPADLQGCSILASAVEFKYRIGLSASGWRLSRSTATVRARIWHVRSLLPSASPNHCRQ